MNYPLLQQYELQSGFGGIFEFPAGKTVRLEPRENAVVLGWTIREHFAVTASRIGQYAKEAEKVILVKDEELKESRLRGARLGRYLVRKQPFELIRVENSHSTLVYEKFPGEPDAEVSVVADSWDHAAELSLPLTNTSEISNALPELVLSLQQ